MESLVLIWTYQWLTRDFRKNYFHACFPKRQRRPARKPDVGYAEFRNCPYSHLTSILDSTQSFFIEAIPPRGVCTKASCYGRWDAARVTRAASRTQLGLAFDASFPKDGFKVSFGGRRRDAERCGRLFEVAGRVSARVREKAAAVASAPSASSAGASTNTAAAACRLQRARAQQGVIAGLRRSAHSAGTDEDRDLRLRGREWLELYGGVRPLDRTGFRWGGVIGLRFASAGDVARAEGNQKPVGGRRSAHDSQPGRRAWGGASRVVYRRERVSSAADPIAGAETFPRDDITCDPRASGSTWSRLVGFAAIGPAHFGLSAQRSAATGAGGGADADRKHRRNDPSNPARRADRMVNYRWPE